MTSAGPLTTLPTELRHQILASVIWTPTATPPDCRSIFRENLRVRLRDDWDIWVPANPPQSAALSVLLTCRCLRNDVQHLLKSSNVQHHPYEIDIVFIPKCGLFPTWICCPLPSQVNLDSLQASFRIMEVEDIDEEGPSKGEFLRHYRGVASDFNAGHCYPNSSPGSWNFYRLLASFLALGPRGLTSPAYQSRHRGSLSTCRRSLRHLIISVTSKEETEIDEKRWARHYSGPARFLIDDQPDLPYGSLGEDLIFPGPSQESPYAWTGHTDLSTVRGMSLREGRLTLGDADRLGLYLANTLWALLDFKWLSRGFGLVVYEGILDDITFYVDGEPRPRFDMDNLLLLEPQRDRTSTPEIAAALQRWKVWVMKWRNKLREGAVLDEPRPSLPFVRYVPRIGASYAPDSESDMDSESGSGSGSDT
ncbi:hypothetical protein B0T21DRAFT_378537 [Apiosordaria backusii]|uniref:Uncharacterized protein n=1 Tax=Apiosordaria backusii TaxID=314023 RepID=A0AA39ZS99_9PEZI|nr:hypothetical protein B0T21DRAFT_378537 [Apiosordaria backusii]